MDSVDAGVYLNTRMIREKLIFFLDMYRNFQLENLNLTFFFNSLNYGLHFLKMRIISFQIIENRNSVD